MDGKAQWKTAVEMKISVAILFAVVALATADQVLYEGYKVFRITPKTAEEASLLDRFRNDEHFDFWTRSRIANIPIDIMVAPSEQDAFISYLSSYQIDYLIKVDDMPKFIINEKLQLKSDRLERVAPKDISFGDYHRYDKILGFLDDFAKRYPQLVTVESFGKTYEGRDMKVLKIRSGNATNKPAIFMDGGIHAREWIAPAVVLYTMEQLLIQNNSLVTDLDWYFVPVLNPDGYEFSHEKDRFWRKTRKPTPNRQCIGTDPNRNFDFHWEGGSPQCSLTYEGPTAFSEAETTNFREYMLANTENVKLYLTMHSYGQYILWPYGYDFNRNAPNWEDLQELGNLMASGIAGVRGTVYDVGNSAETLYPASGAGDDWVYERCKVPLVYTVELPGGGDQGFDLPKEEIQGVVEETFEGIKNAANYVLGRFVQ